MLSVAVCLSCPSRRLRAVSIRLARAPHWKSLRIINRSCAYATTATANAGLLDATREASVAISNGLDGRKLRIAVIGGGPAGFYAAGKLLAMPESQNLSIDMFEELPVPFGLVRYGVAPDHPEVKVSGSLCALHVSRDDGQSIADSCCVVTAELYPQI